MAKSKRAPQPKNSLPPEQLLTCERCGRDRSEHEHANLSDGAFVGRYLLICPTSIFVAKGYDQCGRLRSRKRRTTKPACGM